MEMTEHIKPKNAEETEEWFLNALSGDALPLEQMMGALQSIVSAGDLEKADDLAELLQDTLAERSDIEGAVRLLQLRCQWRENDGEFRAVCMEATRNVLKGRLGEMIARNVGFENAIPLRECLRRLESLSKVKPGVLCHDKTWGFGIVKLVDDFYQKVTIDFETRPGHQMSAAYAAERLELIGDDHFLARRHRDRAELDRLVNDDPAGLVKIALMSYGPLTAPDLKAILVGNIFPEADWKRFWEAARKQLKADPLVDLPAQRTEPIRLRARAKDYGDEWFARVAGERDPETIVQLAEEFDRESDRLSANSDRLMALAEKLCFAVKDSEDKRLDLVARAVMVARRIGLDLGHLDPDVVTAGFFVEERFLAASAMMSARQLASFIEYLAQHDAQRTSGLMLSALSQAQWGVFSAATDLLLSKGREKECFERLKFLVTEGSAGIEVIYWLCRHPDTASEHAIIAAQRLIMQAIDFLDGKFTGERQRTQKHLRGLFDQKEWLARIMSSMDGMHRRSVLSRINASRGWDACGKRSVLAKIIKLYPELEEIIASSEADAEHRERKGRCTSWRSYREKQEQFRKLVEEDIPRNSREIALARSYGDLRENHEYKAAKEHQGILLRRRGDIETELQNVRGADFSGLPTDAAGVGTRVAVRKSDGRIQRYCILGEWDRDESLGIISSSARVAGLLEGRKPGDKVALPDTDGEEMYEIVEVTGLSDEIKTWIMG